MARDRGFTLFEIIVVLIIIGITLALAFPNFNKPMNQASAQAAKNNLMAMYSAELNHFNDHNGDYYFSPTTTDNDLANINTALSLSITDNTYSYNCSEYNNSLLQFQCTAWYTDSSNNTTTITINNTGPVSLTGNVNPNCVGPNCS